MQGDTKATVYGVVAEDASGSPEAKDRFEFTNDHDDLATRLFDIAEMVRTRVDSLSPECVVVRRADFPPAGSRKEGPKVRLLFEGAIVSAARSRCVNTHIATAHDIGKWRSSDKPTVDAEAKTMMTTSGFTQKYAVAASAALGALSPP